MISYGVMECSTTAPGDSWATLKTTGLHTFSGRTVWYVNDVSLKLLFPKYANEHMRASILILVLKSDLFMLFFSMSVTTIHVFSEMIPVCISMITILAAQCATN